ncbi:MAG: lipopolysaccharide heptosyltransferase II [Pyrinomonadaceae bacterium]
MKIVVRGTNWIGDGVMTVPALRELRRIFPGAAITLHTRAWARGVFEDADFIDELLTFETSGAFGEVWSQSGVLRSRRFDLGIVLPNSFASAATLALGRVSRRFGYAADGRSVLLTDAVPKPDWKSERHEVYYYLNLVAAVERELLQTSTVGSAEPDTRLHVSPERKAAARRMLADAGIGSDRSIVALGVGSTNSMAKRWPAERYALLSDRLNRELGASVIMVGSAAERSVADQIAQLASHKPAVLAGATGLGEAVAILSIVDLLVSNDMGLAHAAPATGTRTLVVFGPTNPITTRPFSPEAEIVRGEATNSDDIWPSVEAVFARAAAMLNEPK